MDKNRGLLSTYAHGALDYVIGAALILAPNLFGFADVGGAPEIIPRILGIGILAMALFTNYELGAIKAIPMRLHKTLDVAAGLYLALSPFIHGFSDASPNMWVPHLVVGAVIALAGIATQSRPMREHEWRGAFS